MDRLTFRTDLRIIALVLFLATSPGRIQAAVEAPRAAAQDPAQTTQLASHLAAGVESLGDLDPTQRARMHQNLNAFLEAGLDPNRLGGLFPVAGQPHLPGAEALRAQDAVADALARGLPVDLMLSKIQEGCRKHVAPARVVAAAERMGAALAAANQFLTTARADGIRGEATDPAVSSVALNVWGGLAPADLEPLRLLAADRARKGGCTLEELVAASDCAAGLLTAGAAAGDAVDIAGRALGNGLTPAEMREMTALVAAAQTRAPFEDVLTTVRGRLVDGVGPHDIAQQMVRAGWLGPGDVPGSGGESGPSTGPGSPGYPGGAGADSRGDPPPTGGTGNTGGGTGNSGG